ncbi:uncharacterized protein SPSK_06750 [Sporothrix schenckii 1099-18]|uniref:Uncharacterized protein n=1 Tax=Sporothrix schenckii 1099-18 TaxID=1397361 RepID=A0A0F2MJT6_SPOSC|nr:uncharacterized protein SPSK_06750 [Sporothrix schenckii 1099-18]KJR89339.1 hypothetical protein SPSK_06750 [Sporothrix schenckii 1099-18]
MVTQEPHKRMANHANSLARWHWCGTVDTVVVLPVDGSNDGPTIGTPHEASVHGGQRCPEEWWCADATVWTPRMATGDTTTDGRYADHVHNDLGYMLPEGMFRAGQGNNAKGNKTYEGG